MHGKLALYHPQHGIIPIAVALLAIIWTTIFLTWIQTYLVADDAEDLALAYLLPTIFIAGHLEKSLSPTPHESDSVTARGNGRMERASHGAKRFFRS
jgi:hypothetical protein